MSGIVPLSRPAWPIARAEPLVRRAGITAPVALLGVRGYFRDTMGVKGKNDVGIYDDAIFVLCPNGVISFNANTDPSRLGMNAKIGKPMAMLAPGTWTYMPGMHKGQYLALVQARPVTVLRGDTEDTGWFGINIHKGGYNTTSSEGCQTIYPDQWDSFISLVQAQMARVERKTISYLLMEAQG